jgi:4-hydroxy-2-oxoheptanedioate aldolase
VNLVEQARASWQQNRALTGFWTAIPAAFSAELIALTGPDYICIDQQHGLIDYTTMLPMLAAIESRGVLPITRVPGNDAWLIGKALDAGAMGVVVPMVNTADEAAQAAAACRYPPDGIRSFGPIRASVAMGTGKPADLGRVLCIVMVETEAGVKNVDAIAATPGIDAIYIGPADLALGLGLQPGLNVADPRHAEAINTIRSACDRAGIVAGIQCDSGEAAARRLAEGFRLVTVGKDSTMLQASALRYLNTARTGVDEEVKLGYT